jgi:CDP-diacylglycerol--glycerol-3-phosphate 3-phosphatidyltransferase
MRGEVDHTQPRSLSDLLRIRFKGVLDGIGRFFSSLGISPIALTLTGLAGHLIAAAFLARGAFLTGGLVLVVLAPLDAIDGTLARIRGETSNFGGFVDSVIDRYSEMVLFGGLLVYYLNRFDKTMVVWVFTAAAGSVLVSYARARGEALGYEVRSGLLTRLERYAILLPSLLLGFEKVGVALVAVFANFTAVQRFVHVRLQARRET